MNAKYLIVMLLIALLAAVKTAAGEPDQEAPLKQRYDAFVKSLHHRRLAEDYPGAVRNLDSPDSNKRIVGIKTLAATEMVPRITAWAPGLRS